MSTLRAKSFSLAHSSYQVGRDPLGGGERFNHGDVAGQIGFMHPAKRAKERAHGRAPAFTGVAMPFASPIIIIVSCPFVIAVAHGAMHGMNVVIPRPFIGGEDGIVGWDNGANLARSAADHTEDGWTVGGKRPVPASFVRPTAWRVCRVSMAVPFFPRMLRAVVCFKGRAGQGAPAGPCRSRGPAPAGAASAPSGGKGPVPAPAEQSVRLSPFPTEGGRAWMGTAGSWQRRCPHDCIGAIAVTAPIGIERLLLAQEAAICATTVGAIQAVGVQVLLQPPGAGRIVQHIGYGKIDYQFLPAYHRYLTFVMLW